MRVTAIVLIFLIGVLAIDGILIGVLHFRNPLIGLGVAYAWAGLMYLAKLDPTPSKNISC